MDTRFQRGKILESNSPHANALMTAWASGDKRKGSFPGVLALELRRGKRGSLEDNATKTDAGRRGSKKKPLLYLAGRQEKEFTMEDSIQHGM